MTNFVFYDTETTGANVRYDQILQFAAILTDEDFNEIESVDLRCRILPFMIPSVDALLVTGVTPDMLDAPDLSHFEMTRIVHDLLSRWAPAVFIGHNTIKFDEEALRQAFWQNLLDPYVTSSRGSLRADLLPILRLVHTLDADAIQVATSEAGNPSFKLDRIATMNGFQNHNAHDALGDVRATIHMAKLARERSPKVWSLMMANADPKRALKAMEANRLFRAMTYFGKPKVMDLTRVAAQPTNAKQIAAFDVSVDPAPYLDLDADAMLAALTGKGSPFQLLRSNAMPTVWDPADLALPADDPLERSVLVARLDAIHNHPTFKDAVAAALEKRAGGFGGSPYVEDQIYDGFASWDDKNRMKRFHELDEWSERAALAASFQDARLKTLATRLVYSNAPEVLPQARMETMTRAVARDRMMTEKEVPWTTIPSAIASLEGREPTPEIAAIAAWLEERRAALAAILS